MTILDDFDDLVARRLRDLVEVGRVMYSTTPADVPIPHRSLGVSTETADFELFVWETGEADLGYGVPGDNHDQHFEVDSPGELDDLLGRLLELARTWRPREPA